MKVAFVDTSAFYAFLDQGDPFHRQAKEILLRAEKERWHLFTTSFVVHESWALIQSRLGWDAVEDWLGSLLPLCELVWVDAPALRTGRGPRPAGQKKKIKPDRLCLFRGDGGSRMPGGNR